MASPRKPYRGIGMEGMLATWYAKNTGKSLAEFRTLAKRIAQELPAGASLLEIAPGPGYLAIELARSGSYCVAGLDISHSFVRIARENAAHAGVSVDFRHGDAAALPFADGQFDFVVCRAAFKNFSDPVGALSEMHRVLRPGGTALIIDMRNNASDAAIERTVAGMHLGRIESLLTKAIFKHMLRKRAYSKEDLARVLAATPFHSGERIEEPLGFELRLRK
ncbi:MAG: class I SAM-dependent methyltransferase [Methylovirgula sp.]